MATDIINTIGTGGDYPDLDTWEAAKGTNHVTADINWIGEVLNDLVITSGLDIAGTTTDATHRTILRCASGQSFRNDPDIRTNPMRLDGNDGVKISGSVSWDGIISSADDYTEIRDLQLENTSSTGSSLSNFSGSNCLIDKCILYTDYLLTDYVENGTKITGSLLVCLATNTDPLILGGYGTAPQVIGCDVVKPSDVGGSSNAIGSYGSVEAIYKSCRFLGFTSAGSNGHFGSGSEYNLFTDATVRANSPNSVNSATFANEVTGTTTVGLDVTTPTTGSDSDDAGKAYPETAEDITGFTRDDPPCIGCYEIGSVAGTSINTTVASVNASAFDATLTYTAPSKSMSVQQVNDSIGNTGGTNTSFTAVSALSKAIELPANNRRTHAGATTLSGSSLEGDDLAGARLLTSTSTLTYYRESGSLASNVEFQTFIWEYIGAASGANEFKVTRFAVDLNGTTASANVDITSAGVTTAADCIPIITGIMNNATADDTDSGTSTAYLTSTTNMVVNKGTQLNNVKVYISLVEFTGSNWNVLHGRSTGQSADTGSINLFDGSDGTGSAATVIAWANALIFGQYRSNTGNADVAIADNWPLYKRGTTGQVDWEFSANHDSASATEEHVVHVLEHTDMDVTIFTDTSSTAGETTIDITSAGLTSLDQALIIGSSISSGTGTALPRGYRNYYFNSTTEMAHWCTRSGNTMSHYLQVVDINGLEEGGAPPSGSTISPSLASLSVEEYDMSVVMDTNIGAELSSVNGSAYDGLLTRYTAFISGLASVNASANDAIVSPETVISLALQSVNVNAYDITSALDTVISAGNASLSVDAFDITAVGDVVISMSTAQVDVSEYDLGLIASTVFEMGVASVTINTGDMTAIQQRNIDGISAIVNLTVADTEIERLTVVSAENASVNASVFSSIVTSGTILITNLASVSTEIYSATLIKARTIVTDLATVGGVAYGGVVLATQKVYLFLTDIVSNVVSPILSNLKDDPDE